jgi:MSHA biogenesis protein MshK
MSRLLAASVCLLVACAAQSAPFADPTRPPASSASDSDAAAPASGPRLESVLIAPDRRVAIISGQQVTVGGRFGEGEVVRITESEVVIRRSEGLQVLKLVPEYTKRPRSSPDKGRQNENN